MKSSILFSLACRCLGGALALGLVLFSVGCAVTPQATLEPPTQESRSYWLKQADFYYSNEDWIAAEIPCLRLTQIEPVSAHDWFRLGNVYGYTDRPRVAFAVYEKAIALAPERAEVRYNLAVTLLRLATEEWWWAIKLGESEEMRRQITELLKGLTEQFQPFVPAGQKKGGDNVTAGESME